MIPMKAKGMVMKAASKPSMVMKASKKKGYVKRKTDPVLRKIR